MRLHRQLLIAAALVIPIMGGCDRSSSQPLPMGNVEVVVYCSVDTEFAEPILAEFEKRTGIKVHRVFDTEAGKTTGLLNRLMAEKARPRADVWWSSEIFGTIQLAEQGVLAEYRPASAADIPEQYRDPAGRWTAVGLRGRVLAYDPKRTKVDDVPTRWCDLGAARYKGLICMADPRFGTTRGHMATLLHVWGSRRFKAFLKCFRDDNQKLSDGNSQSVLLLTRGRVQFAATDTDDVISAQQRGDSVEMVYPDLSPFGSAPYDQDADRRLMVGEPVRMDIEGTEPKSPPVGFYESTISHPPYTVTGTLWIPCTVAAVKNGPNPVAAQRIVEYLVSAEVEEKLAKSESRNVPVRYDLRQKLKIADPSMASVDYAAVAKRIDESDQLIREILSR
jgi:iron(III) transport system substrate-binding protein